MNPFYWEGLQTQLIRLAQATYRHHRFLCRDCTSKWAQRNLQKGGRCIGRGCQGSKPCGLVRWRSYILGSKL